MNEPSLCRDFALGLYYITAACHFPGRLSFLLVEKNRKCVSASGLRNMGAVRARLPFMAPVCSQFVGWSEHTCGPKAQQSVDSSGMGGY